LLYFVPLYHEGGLSKNPFKVFRWAAKMTWDDSFKSLSRRPGGWYNRSLSEVDWAKVWEVAKGDIDASNLVG
jgi:hypothetical protein